MSPLDETLRLLGLTELRCTVSVRSGTAVINRDGGMQVIVTGADDGCVEVRYEQALHDTACETCKPDVAASLVRAILLRTRLEYVPLPRV